MSGRYDLLTGTGRERANGKEVLVKIGAAWPLQGGGFRIVFDALPIRPVQQTGTAPLTAILLPARERPAGGGVPDGLPPFAEDDFR